MKGKQVDMYFWALPYFALLLRPVQDAINAFSHSRRYGIEDLWTIQGQKKNVRYLEGDDNLVTVGWNSKRRENRRSHFRR
jgi:hypothetical protein